MSSTTLPGKIIELNRTAASAAIDAAASAVKVAGDSARTVLGVSKTAGKAVVGQTRSSVERTATTARTGTDQVRGTASAQGKRVATAIDDESNRVVDRAISSVDDMPGSGTPYEEWTREQLYRRAQELDIEGRSSMSKKQLIAALRS